ncbi:MAG: phosphoribosylformylglycinamidine synthase PurS subunit [Vicingaceae bacterium]|jgi:phosphoribosylformylglycinamidine synthase
MKFTAEIDIMPLKALLDPQGKAVTSSLKNLDLSEINNVRIGKHITLDIEAANESAAELKVEQACKKILANHLMESYTYSVEAV